MVKQKRAYLNRLFKLIIFFHLALLISIARASHFLTFQQALALAYANNPELKAEIAKAHAMKGFFIQSKQYPNPTVLLEAENIGGSGSFQGFESAETTLSVFQPIPLGNRLQYAQFATLADYIASLASIAVQQSRLYIAVGIAYIDTLNANQWHQITKKLTRLNEQIVTEVNRRVVAGAGSQLDLKLAQIRLGTARIQEKRAYQDIVTSRTKLERLIGKQISPQAKLTYQGLAHRQWAWKNISKRIDCSPSVNEKLLRLKAKRATITSVKKNVWPNLNLQLGVRHFSDDGSNAAVVSASAPLPIFDKNQGRVATEEAGYTQIWHEMQGLRLELKQNLFALFLQGKQSYYELQEVRQSLLPLARNAVSLARQGYLQGLYSYIELVNAITILYQEEKHFQQAHAEIHKVAIQINGLLGLCKTQDVK